MLTTSIYTFFENLIIKHRRVVVIFIHLINVIIANYLAFTLRFEVMLSPAYVKQFKFYLPILLAIRLGFFLYFRLYKDLWRYSSVDDLTKLIKSVSLGSVVFFVVVRYLFNDTNYPRSVYILDWMLLLLLAGGLRLTIRVFKEHLHSERSGKRVILIGAGDAGEMIVRDMRNNPKYAYEPIGFIDDNLYKKGTTIHGIPIFGPSNMLDEVIGKHKPEEIFITMPSANHNTLNEIYNLCKPFNIPIKTLPGMSDILDGKVAISNIRPLSLEDLLQREPVKADIQSVKEYVEGKVVLVTGAGGSIGSELCRQIFEYSPSHLILFDRYENGLFDIDLELNIKRKENGKTVIHTIVGDMCDIRTLDCLFSQHKPQIVFHAAAHKHVPLMELNPFEAVKNNIFGTKNLLNAATKHNSERFVMISTDKAVNPANIMGATKRVAEFMTINMNHASSVKATIVRFGNVLGSNGSVIHIFKEQVKQGGPLTVTHPEIKRFFMLIPEAVQLVLIAGSAGRGGDIFVLEMGEQIRILDLAENFIKLSGFIPHEDIKIEFIGLRPGEKLYEELFDESELVSSTFHEKLRILTPNYIPSVKDLNFHIANLERIIANNSVEELVSELQEIVPTFKKHPVG